MARIKLLLPSEFNFFTLIQLRISDINYGGHLGNDALLGIIHEARMQYFMSFGFSELNLGGQGSIMADCAICYRAEAIYGEMLKIEVAAAEFHAYGFDLFYKISKKTNNILVAEAKTHIISFDYQTHKRALLPAVVLEKLSGSII